MQREFGSPLGKYLDGNEVTGIVDFDHAGTELKTPNGCPTLAQPPGRANGGVTGEQ